MNVFLGAYRCASPQAILAIPAILAMTEKFKPNTVLLLKAGSVMDRFSPLGVGHKYLDWEFLDEEGKFIDGGSFEECLCQAAYWGELALLTWSLSHGATNIEAALECCKQARYTDWSVERAEQILLSYL